jgi:hypothetical protein
MARVRKYSSLADATFAVGSAGDAGDIGARADAGVVVPSGAG